MPIVSSDIKLRYAVKTGSAGDTVSGNAAGSLGKYVSTTEIVGGMGALFDNISGAENAASTVDYRCFFVLNNHATLTLENAVVFVQSEVSGGANIALATDNIAVSAKGASSAQAAEVANETTAPSGVSAFSTPTTSGTGLSLGSIGPGQVKAVWVRRTATNSSALNNDGVTVAINGDTAE